MIVALIHWRVKLGEEHEKAFLQHWQTRNTIANRSGVVVYFSTATKPYTRQRRGLVLEVSERLPALTAPISCAATGTRAAELEHDHSFFTFGDYTENLAHQLPASVILQIRLHNGNQLEAVLAHVANDGFLHHKIAR